MVQTKKVYADGAVIFREGDTGESSFELLSGTVDLLVKRDGKYARERSVEAGGLFGVDTDTRAGIRLFTARANGRAVVRTAAPETLPATITSDTPPALGVITRLIKSFSRKHPTDSHAGTAEPYKNPGLLRRLMDGMGTDMDRIGIRVARLSGHEGEKHTRHLISAIGNSGSLQTRGIDKTLSINPEGDIPKQLARLAVASRRYLASQDADLLIWGHVPEAGDVMHLHFVTHVYWDQQAPGAFDLETTLALPTDFDGSMADLLRTVCLAAALPKVQSKKRMQSEVLPTAIGLAETVFEDVPRSFSEREKACLYLCYGNAIAVAARPGYDPTLLAQAQAHYRSALGSLNPDATPIDWAQAKKHLGSILHIEAARNSDPEMLGNARTELEDALGILDPDRHGQMWAIIHNRLGLIYYRQGFDEGDTQLLRRALRSFQLALRIYSRSETPSRWAEIMSNFAQSAQVLGGLLQSPDALATAVNACRSVMEMRDREKAPRAWAASQNNLGSALFLLGKQTRNIGRLEESLHAFENAMDVYEQLGLQRMAITTARNLDRAKDMVEFYQPRNVSQLDWEDALAEGVGGSPKTPAPTQEAPAKQNDDLPWPGEALPQQAVG